MFHYRNHGAAYGRILVGIQLPKGERRAFEQVLDELHFPYWEETKNRAYQLYLGNRAG
jgi:threonine dehydratase